jgi:hypothetical protein
LNSRPKDAATVGPERRPQSNTLGCCNANASSELGQLPPPNHVSDGGSFRQKRPWYPRQHEHTTPITTRRPDDPRQHARQRRAVARGLVLNVPSSNGAATTELGKQMEFESFIRFVVLIFAVALFTVSAFLYLKQETGAASAAMGFVFLLVFVLTISNFKRIKGFGFEAEMWEEKQVQAAKLIDRLELLSKATAQQVALIAAKLGLMGSGMSNPEMGELVESTRQILQSTGTTDTERKNILAPLYRRVALNYVNAANRVLQLAVENDRKLFDAARLANPDDHQKWQEKLLALDKTTAKMRQLNRLDMIERRTIEPIESMAQQDVILGAEPEVIAQLNEIAADMSYFEANGKLRRSIDWSYQYK